MRSPGLLRFVFEGLDFGFKVKNRISLGLRPREHAALLVRGLVWKY